MNVWLLTHNTESRLVSGTLDDLLSLNPPLTSWMRVHKESHGLALHIEETFVQEGQSNSKLFDLSSSLSH